MPDAIEPQLDELRRRARRRLVGAVVLALAAAVLVPMLLESDPKPLGEDVSVKIPPVDEGKFVSKLGEKGRAPDAPPAKPAVPSSSPAASDAAATPSASKEPAKEPPTVSAVTPAPRKAEPPAPNDSAPAKLAPKDPSPGVAPASVAPPKGVEPPKSAVKPSTEAPAADAATKPKPAGAFSVQLAAFADDKGANALASRLKKGGHPAYTEPYATSRGTLWRVRVGPYATREAAEAARDKLKADGQNGIIAAAN